MKKWAPLPYHVICRDVYWTRPGAKLLANVLAINHLPSPTRSQELVQEQKRWRIDIMNVYSSALRRGAELMHIDPSKIWDRTVDVAAANWHLGFTAFGGPPVHFQIVRATVQCPCTAADMVQLHKKFMEKYKWVDEQLV
jgi:hypothetical protein